MKRKFIWYILLILWMGLIFYSSSITGTVSTGSSKGIIYSLFKLINVEIDLNTMEILNYIFRKFMHISVFFILALLFFNSLRVSDIKNRLYRYTFIFCYIYACSDEIHQLFTGRTGMFLDTLIDSIGILLFIEVHYLISKKTRH